MSRILVVDDEPDLRFLLRRIFERAGHDVVDASHGIDALESVRTSPPDLVVTDMMMPVMDGVELISRLRSDPATAGIPILAVTGDSELAGDADAVLAKPYDPGELVAAADALLTQKAGPKVKRLTTGVPGLDVVLGGGLEPGAVMVLAGAPGTGKTILAQQICFANADETHRAVYYTTLSEPHSKLVRHLESFDFFVPKALGPKVEYIHLGDLIREDQSGGLELLVAEVVRKTMEDGPVLVVIDSAKALRDFIGERELRIAFYDLTSRLAHTDAALILLGEYTGAEMEGGVEFSLADGIVQLAYEPREPIDRRWLRVVKMRGRRHLEGKHTFRIGPSGFEIFPRIETLDVPAAAAVRGRISSGIPGLDELMGGGIGSGEATVVLGPSGVGKTIFGLRFVAEGLAKGQRCLYVTFQDSSDQLINMAAAFGWDLGQARSDGRLVVHHVPLGELDLDILTSGIRKELAESSIASRRHRQPGRDGVRRSRVGALPRLRPQPDRADPQRGRLAGDHQRDHDARPHARAGRGSPVPVPQRDPAALHRAELRHRPSAEHRQDAQQQPQPGRARVRHRRTRLDDRERARRGHRRDGLERAARSLPRPPRSGPVAGTGTVPLCSTAPTAQATKWACPPPSPARQWATRPPVSSSAGRAAHAL